MWIFPALLPLAVKVSVLMMIQNFSIQQGTSNSALYAPFMNYIVQKKYNY